MPRKFGQDTQDRVVRPMEDRILAENMSMQEACKIAALKLGVSWHTARLMRLAGVSGKGKGRSPITTRSPQHS
ncbi:hypothetical protein [Corynebacterium pseudodiphtheriticum]|uniref:hypothetical protein n=1 Tax=Corynebacterium pseudodiphtheriticum TaxID=37637 RepID=UPI003D72A7EF